MALLALIASPATSALLAVAAHRPRLPVSERTSVWRLHPPRCAESSCAPAEVEQSLYPTWPRLANGKMELSATLAAFESIAEDVPLKAATLPGDGWREWSDGGFDGVKLIATKLSRVTYIDVLTSTCRMLVALQAAHPDLYAVLKFVPKKNGLNPWLASVQKGNAGAARIDKLRPREVRRRLDDLQRTFEQSWLLVCVYLTTGSSAVREDLTWATRTVVEKIRTDQRSRALEMLCLGVFHRSAKLSPLVTGDDARWRLRRGFETNFGEAWVPKPANARMVWQRSRTAYPLLEIAHRVWLAGSGQLAADAEWSDASGEGDAAIAGLLDRIAWAGPEERVVNSLLYWVIDLCYRVMLRGETVAAYAPEPYILRRAGVEERMIDELSRAGHLLQLLARTRSQSNPSAPAPTAELILEVKEVAMTTTLLASIKAACEDECPIVLDEYEEALAHQGFTLEDLERIEFEALGALLDLEGSFVAARAERVHRAMAEWRNPELLFRYLDANRHDEKMSLLILRWLRATFGLSNETVRMIRREAPENVRHLLQFPQHVLLRWYSDGCPGTSKSQTLFMLGEDASSCLRITSKDGNRYNKALMGYVLQSHVRALVVTDSTGMVLVRSLIRLVLRSDTLTPIIFCDPMFFTLGYSKELQRELLFQARVLEEHMQVPVVHAGSVLPVLEKGTPRSSVAFEPYVRHVQELDYDVTWVDLIEMDGVAPYTYSEELPYDELLQQHTPGVLSRTPENPVLVIAALPRADSPSAARYVLEREGETAWTMHTVDGGEAYLPKEVSAQVEQGEHVTYTFDPNARAWDEIVADEAPPEYKPPRLDE